MKTLTFRADLCNGCRVCEETCAQTYFKVTDNLKSSIRIYEAEGTPPQFSANFCNQCGECIDICPTMALRRDKNGIVRLDKRLCVGCLSCVGFCPNAAMRIHAELAVPFKCVACGQCAKKCPTGALSVEEVADAELTVTEIRLKAVAA